eukprot:3568930-Pyramimonas_sp.AAC.1
MATNGRCFCFLTYPSTARFKLSSLRSQPVNESNFPPATVAADSQPAGPRLFTANLSDVDDVV